MTSDLGTLQLLAVGVLLVSTLILGSAAISWWQVHFRMSRLEARRHGIASGNPQNSHRRRLQTLSRHLSKRARPKQSTLPGMKAPLKIIDLPPDMEIEKRQLTVGLFAGFFITTLVLYLSGLNPAIATTIAAMLLIAARRITLNYLINRRQGQFTEGFNEAIETILRSSKVGVPIVKALKMATYSTTPVVRYEFTQIVSRLDLGEPFSDAIDRLEVAMPTKEVGLFVACLKIQIQGGASMSATLESLLDILRKRRTLALKITAITSEARSSAMAIAGMVPLFAVAMWLFIPDYFDPLFDSETGNYVAMFCALSLISGVAMIIRLGQARI
jgi:tight adherence protein B